MLTQYLEARVIRGALFRELEEGAYTAVIGFLKDEDIAVDEGTGLEEEKSVGWEVDGHEWHHGDQLVNIDESPERLH